MSRSLVERFCPLAIVLALAAACSDDELDVEGTPAEHASAADAAPSKRPLAAGEFAKLDRGDGCYVDLLVEGPGRALAAGDEVIFAYDARVCGAEAPFASTRDWITPCVAKLDSSGHPPLIAGLVRGLTGLTVGTKARIEVPPELAYGKEGLPSAGIPADSALVFDVEVLGIR
jgi:FKBP-type peptidyl-prolyl cis-trans isomerase